MKTKTKLTLLLCVATLFPLASCSHDDDPVTPDPQPAAQSINLEGTSWQSDVSNTYTYHYAGYAIDMNCSQITIIDLNDATHGEMFVEVNVEVPSAPAASQNQSYTEAVTYTFDGTTLKLTSAYSSYEGDDGVLTFHPADTTFTMPVGDAQSAEMLGTDTLVFRLIQGTVTYGK